MADITELRSLINLIGKEENYSCNVSLKSNLDSNAKKELEEIHRHRSASENDSVERLLHDTFHFPRSDDVPIWTYAKQIYGVLLQICNKLEAHEDFPVAVDDAKKILIAIRKAIEYGLKPFLLAVMSSKDTCLPFIIANVNILLKILDNQHFTAICTRNEQPLFYTDLVSSVFTVMTCGDDETKTIFETHLRNIKAKISRADYLKILFLIRGNQTKRALLIQRIAEIELIQDLYRPGSFVALSEALLPSITSLDQDDEIMTKRIHCCGVISTIIARRGLRKDFFRMVIDEIFCHLMTYIRSNRSQQLFYIDVGVRCLSKLCTLQLNFINRQIISLALGWFDKLVKPPELLAGTIVCEPEAFREAIHLVHLTFCATGPSDDTLPSEFLVPYMPLFLQLHHMLSDSTDKLLKNDLLAIIVRCLSNREVHQLNQIIEKSLYEDFEDGDKYLHPRLQINRNVVGEEEALILKIRSDVEESESSVDGLDIDSFLRPSTTLINVLKQCNHNMLIYNVFIHLLQMFSNNFGTSEATQSNQMASCELLEDESEFSNAIEKRFKRKYAIVHGLNELILFESFHSQFHERPHEIIEILNKMLNQQITRIESNEGMPQNEENEDILVVILSIVGEFFKRVQNDELKLRLQRTLSKLRSAVQNSRSNTVSRKLDYILGSHLTPDESSEFLVAKAILSETHSEPYTKVYGIMNMIKLVNAKDEETRLNAHAVLALAMKMLREEDSYIFLNCIKLLISLVELLEDTVLETLIAEYHFDIDSNITDVDFKLKVGETIVKVSQGLGEMCHKYKTILVNSFLRGACNRNDEFRTSNMANLGVILKILTYQVHHFFQEVMTLIQTTLQCDKYLPARRAAALVLDDLLNGMKSLEQFQDYLLPIYRTLKHIEENDSDLHMQIHAKNGLSILKDKVKEAFSDEAKLEKPIRIFDVKSDDKSVRFK